MQFKWLNKQNNKKLIVFFNGWGMNAEIVSNLKFGQFDVLVLFDYGSFEIPDFDFSQYENKNLIAWSMGVYVCNYFYEKFKSFNSFTAINGTLKPINDQAGIPVMIYNMTIENFNEQSCRKFLKKISSDVNLQNYCTRDTEELKNELIKIKELKTDNFFTFDKAYISQKDRIFPYKNQMNFWTGKTKIIELEAPHYIFNLYENWSDLL